MARRGSIAARVAGAALFVAALVLPAVPAWGHAAYTGSDPPDEGTVARPPSEVWAEYSEPIGPGSYLKIYDPCGARVDNGDWSYSGQRMTVSMAGTRSGTYEARWQAASQVDPHVTRGTFIFEVLEGEPCPGDEPEQPRDGGGNGGNGGGDGPSGGDDGDQTSSAAGPGGGGSGGDAGGRSSQPGGGEGGRARGNATDERPSEPSAPQALERGEEGEEGGRSVFDGIELGDLLLALFFAALIGAAGGKVYAGILGPRDA